MNLIRSIFQAKKGVERHPSLRKQMLILRIHTNGISFSEPGMQNSKRKVGKI